VAGVYPIPTTRTSDLLGQVRLLTQLQADQLDVLRYQGQISTGRRVLAPSDDAPASLRAMTLQRLLELKAQARTNLSTSQSYLDATDVAVAGVSNTLNEIRSTALSVVGTTSSDSARRAAAEEVRRAIESLIAVGNQNFRGRYLFAGSRTTVSPFEMIGPHVVYRGNEGELESFVDLDVAVATSVPGSEIFGAYTPGITGSVDLDPVLTRDTLLTDLHGGSGIAAGSLAISDGTTTRIIDISSAATIGDVADLIESQPPPGRQVYVHVTATGLEIDLDDAGGGNLTIREVGGGTTAAELGILEPVGTLIGPIVGGDLNPRLRLTTRIDQVLGSRAVGYLQMAGANNDLVLEARQVGPATNGFRVQLVDDSLLHASPGLVAGSEFATLNPAPTPARAALNLAGFGNNLLLTASAPGTSFNNVRIELVDAGAIGNAATATYNPGTKTLSLGIDSSGGTQIQTLVNAINSEGTFSAAYDPSDPVDGGYNPAAAVQAVDIAAVTGSTGNSGGAANTIFVHVDPGATTANQVLAALQGNPALDALFEIRLDGSDTSSASLAGEGFVPIGASAAISGGSGVQLDLTSGLRIENGGSTYDVAFSGAQTIEDLLNILNGSPANVLAEIDPAGDRIRIRSRLSGADFRIGENGGTTATQLGVRSFTVDTSLNELNYRRGVATTAGADITITRKDGVQLAIDLDGAQTVGDVLDLINSHPSNLDANRVVASLAAVGNGIVLTDNNLAGGGTLRIDKTFTSQAAWDLGLIPQGEQSAVAAAVAGQPDTITGSDTNPLEVAGVFNSLIRLYDALSDFSLPDVERAVALLDADYERINFSRAEIGARGRNLETLAARLEDEDVQLQGTLSDEIDTDLATAISNLTARQAALEASLRLAAQTFQLTLLNFL
jgi:flagellar hook-associated protein 3 FlgL